MNEGGNLDRVSIRELSFLECIRGFLGFHIRREIFGGYVLRGKICLSGGSDGVKELVNLVLYERVQESDAS